MPESLSISPKPDLPSEFKRTSGNFTIEPSFVAQINEGYLFGDDAIAFTPSGCPIVESTYARRDALEYRLGKTPLKTAKMVMSNNYLKSTESVQQEVCPLTSTHYYHWLLNELPRIRGVEYYEKETGTTPKILIPEPIRQYEKESLRLLGINDEQIITWEGGCKQYQAVIIPSIASPEMEKSSIRQAFEYDLSYKIYSPEALRWVRRKVLDNIDLDTDATRLFIARTDTNRRRVINREELLATLKQNGFEVFVPGNHSFETQARKFASAELIVGPHGAGLTNIIFSPDARVIELVGEKNKPTKFLLSSSLGLEYRCIVCENRGKDIYVDIDRVMRMVEEYL